jgi:hypothetical protein
MRVVERDRVDVASLWALVINTDDVGRDVYIAMWVIDASDAIRAAQPEGVVLPTL